MYFDNRQENRPPPIGYRGPGGFKAPPLAKPRPPPPGADPQLWEWFNRVDKDQSGDIDATELQVALVNGDWSHFNLNTVNLLMNIVDLDRDDRINFNEFADLWSFIKLWQSTFHRFDVDKSGTIDRTELQNALTDFGYVVTPQLLNILQHKYDVKAPAPHVVPSPKVGTPPGITFDHFVRACVVLHQVTEAFKKLHTDREGWVKIDYLQFLQTVLSLP
jgi:Ca2+-binding EF-hand superfamily protein